MILVIMQHAYHLIDPSKALGPVNLTIYGITRMASVAFMAVSGMMISYFLETRPDWKQVQSRFAKRAIFLILFAHPAIALVRYYYYDGDRLHHFLLSMYQDYPITDTIAFCLLLAPLIIRFTKPAGRVALIVAMLAVTPLVSAFYQPTSGVPVILKIALFGKVGTESAVSVPWPLIPWLAIFLCGALMGEGLASIRTGHLPIAELVRKMRKTAFWLAGVGVVLSVGYKVLKMQMGGSWDPNFFDAIYPTRTTSLLPIYLAVLLGIFSFLMVRIDIRHKYDRAAWFASVFGRTSLFTYISQFAVVHTTPALLGLKGHLTLTGYVILFVVGLPISWLISYSYGRFRGWITQHDYSRLVGMQAPPKPAVSVAEES